MLFFLKHLTYSGAIAEAFPFRMGKNGRSAALIHPHSLYSKLGMLTASSKDGLENVLWTSPCSSLSVHLVLSFTGGLSSSFCSVFPAYEALPLWKSMSEGRQITTRCLLSSQTCVYISNHTISLLNHLVEVLSDILLAFCEVHSSRLQAQKPCPQFFLKTNRFLSLQNHALHFVQEALCPAERVTVVWLASGSRHLVRIWAKRLN